MPNPPPPLPPADLQYSNLGKVQRVPYFSLRISLVMWIGGFLLLGFLLFGVGRFEQIFRDFKTELPLVTKWLLTVGRWTMNDYGWLFLLPVICVAPLLAGFLLPVGVADVEAYRRRKRWVTLLLVTLMIAVGLFLLWSLFAPLLALVQSISGGPGKK